LKKINVKKEQKLLELKDKQVEKEKYEAEQWAREQEEKKNFEEERKIARENFLEKLKQEKR